MLDDKTQAILHKFNQRFHPGQVVRHFKWFDNTLENADTCSYLYRILGIVTHTETGDLLVVYESFGGLDPIRWARPIEDFCSEVDRFKYPNCSQNYRFEAFNP